MLRYALLFIYVFVNILLIVLNWDICTTTVSFNLGIAVFDTLPFLVLQLFGGAIIAMLIALNSTRNLLKEINTSFF